MISTQESSVRVRYLLGLETPANIAAVVESRRRQIFCREWIPTPLPPMLPLACGDVRPKEPVPGLLPTPRSPLPMENEALLGEWLLWSVAVPDWIGELMKALDATSSWDLYPLRRGVPLAVRSPRFPEAPVPAPPEVPPALHSWRTMVLVCHQVEYQGNQDWWKAFSTGLLWKRRLRKTPSTSSNKAT